MKRWPRVTGTWWAVEIESPHPPIFPLLPVASQGNHLMVGCSQQQPEQVGTGRKNKWGGEKSTETTDDVLIVWEAWLLMSQSILIHFKDYGGFIGKSGAYIPPWSCLAMHLRLLCRFMKLAARVKLFPKKKIILFPTFVHITVVLYKFTGLHTLKRPINLKVVSAGEFITKSAFIEAASSLAHGQRHRGPGGCSTRGAPSRNGKVQLQQRPS